MAKSNLLLQAEELGSFIVEGIVTEGLGPDRGGEEQEPPWVG